MVKHMGHVDYKKTLQSMQSFTASRTAVSTDEIWIVQHPAVYTLGVAGRREHLPRSRKDIPVVEVDRGGQITYHGPGQVIAYVLLDMKRRDLAIRDLVNRLEQAVIDLLLEYGITSNRRNEAPGVYIGEAKIAALGLRITRGCSYHGLALNVDMDLTPFHVIDPCGYPGLAVTQMRDLGVTDDCERVGDKLVAHLVRLLA